MEVDLRDQLDAVCRNWLDTILVNNLKEPHQSTGPGGAVEFPRVSRVRGMFMILAHARQAQERNLLRGVELH